MRISSQESFHPLRFSGALAIFTSVTFAIPLPVLLSEPVSGLTNLVIIGIGLLQAWRIIQPDQAPILGPLSVN